MNILLLSNKNLETDGRYRVDGDEFIHLKKILKVDVGHTVFTGLINGGMGYSKVLEIQADHVLLDGNFTLSPPVALPIKLILALPRPLMLKRILRNISMLGVKEIHLINTKKVEKSFWQSQLLEPDSYEKYILEGLSQAKDTVLPSIHMHKRFKLFVEDDLPTIMHKTKPIIAHPGEYPAFPQGITDPMTLAIGPEGGFTDYEVAKFIEIGFEAHHCGSRILRMETAVVSLLSQHQSFLA